MRDILTVYKKEVRSILKDKTVLFMCLFLPALFMVMEGFLMGAMNDDGEAQVSYNAYVVDAPADIAAGLKEIGFSDAAVDKDKVINDIKNKDAEMLIVFPKDFKIGEDSTSVPDIQIWYNSSNVESLKVKELVTNFLDTLRPVVFTVNSDTNTTYDLGDENYQGKNYIASMVPGLLIMVIVYGIMSLASNIIAGDKESNFLNTVLITPVKRSSVAIGKALAVMTAAGISSVSAFIGLAYLMKTFQKMIGEGAISYAITDYVLVFLVILCVTFALVGLILIISTVAKSTRSAQTLTTIPVVILFIGSFLTSNAGMDKVLTAFGTKNYFIPMWNATYLTKNILLTGVSTSDILITCAINIVFGIACLAIVSNLFNNEKIVNA